MLKLTRLNNHVVAINPDHIAWVDATPDTTLFLLNGEKIIVRETLDELISAVIEFRKQTHGGGDAIGALVASGDIDPPRIGSIFPRRTSELPRKGSQLPPRLRGDR